MYYKDEEFTDIFPGKGSKLTYIQFIRNAGYMHVSTEGKKMAP